MADKFSFSVTINATPEDIFPALGRAEIVNRWQSDMAFFYGQPHVGSYYFLGWFGMYQVAGEFTAVEANKRLAMTWRGLDEHLTTNVEYTLEPTDGGTRITMTQSGYSESAADQEQLETHKLAWNGLLDNLKHFIEYGTDLRVQRRPMLGIFLSNLTPENKERYGFPVDAGVYIEGTVDGSGAQKAGIQQHDLVVSIDGKPVRIFEDVRGTLSGHNGGDVVPVVYYRGAERHEVPMELTKREEPNAAATAPEMADALNKLYEEVYAEIVDTIKDVPEEIAAQRPEPNEWSVNENLAHLIWEERYIQMSIWNYAGLGEGVDWPDNNAAHLAGIISSYRTKTALLAELKRSMNETVAQITTLPEDAARRRFVLVTTWLTVEGLPRHTREHIAQMKKTVEQITAAAVA